MANETKGTVLVALGANLGVGVAKGVGGALTGSSALIAEAAHSVADTLNEIFLLLSLGRADRPADRTHPFGYGKERFFWSLLAAIGIFLSGAVFSVAEGVFSLLTESGERTSTRDFVIIYAILGISLVLEGSSLVRALRQVHGEAASASRRLLTFVLRSPDPTVKTVATEDSVAVVGVLVAVLGTALHQVTGSEVYDAASSMVIGVLLAYVAFLLGRDTKELLIGEAADPAVRVAAFQLLTGRDEIVRIKEMLTMQLGPDSVLLGVRLQFAEHLTASDLEDLCTDLEVALRDEVPSLTQVFLDPSRATDEESEHIGQLMERTVDEARSLSLSGASDRGPRTRTAQQLTTGADDDPSHPG